MSLAEAAAGVNDAFTSIPIIDLSKDTTPEGRTALAHEIRDACMKVGFFYIQNHSIPQTCFDNILTAMQTYFSLPVETKMKLHHKTVANFKGYSPPLDANIDPANNHKGDFHEGFEIGWEELEAKAIDEKRANDGAMAGSNVWPSDDCPGFRDACLEYYHAVVSVGRALFPLFALALELPETYFSDMTKNSAAIMRTLHYPLQDGHPDVDDETPGIGAHTDFECFTILWQQPDVQVLQVMNSEKRWINAPPIKGTLVVNIGDQLAMWTNDVFKSTVHRAMNKSGKERYSIPLFFGTDYHVNIEPIPSCVSANRPAKYSPVTAGDYVNKRLKDMYHTV
ncbi:2OG-Fe(II) oxygenase [Melanogaster broomeanus]|nr:2OG-Fe(II) oxygenase [Melanogaster broomeanus]